MAKTGYIPGFPLALRQVVEETEQAILNVPFASKMSGYSQAIQAGFEEDGFELLRADKRGRADIAVRKRGYVIGLKIGQIRLSSRTLEAFANYKADYRVLVLRDWKVSDEPRRNISGVDQVITPFRKKYNAKTGVIKDIHGVAKNTNDTADNEDYNGETTGRPHTNGKNAAKHSIFQPQTSLRARARKSLEVSSKSQSGRKTSLLASLEEKDLPSRDSEKEVRFANQNSLSGLVVDEPKNYKLDLTRMRASHEQVKQTKRVANVQDRSRLQGRRCRIAWSELDQTGRPVLSFEPTDLRRPALLKILTRDARDRTRQACVRKLGIEFSRIYERYRAACNRRDGRLGTAFRSAQIDVKHRQYSEQIAVHCIEFAVTPRVVLEYWDKNIKDFTDGQVTVPPLAFLKSASVIDRVACSSLGGVGKSDEGRARTGKGTTDRNPYADLSRLDEQLRRMLESAGYDTTRFNDRYLLSVQHNAIAVARGADLLLVPGQFGDMIKTAAEWYRGKLEAPGA